MVLYHFLKLLDTPEVFAVKWYDVWNLYMKIFKQKKKLQDEGGDRQNKKNSGAEKWDVHQESEALKSEWSRASPLNSYTYWETFWEVAHD